MDLVKNLIRTLRRNTKVQKKSSPLTKDGSSLRKVTSLRCSWDNTDRLSYAIDAMRSQIHLILSWICHYQFHRKEVEDTHTHHMEVRQ